MKKSKLRIGKKIKSVIALLMCVTLFASCYGGFLSKETIVSPGEGNIVINEPPARSDHDQEQWYQSSETKTFVLISVTIPVNFISKLLFNKFEVIPSSLASIISAVLM